MEGQYAYLPDYIAMCTELLFLKIHVFKNRHFSLFFVDKILIKTHLVYLSLIFAPGLNGVILASYSIIKSVGGKLIVLTSQNQTLQASKALFVCFSAIRGFGNVTTVEPG